MLTFWQIVWLQICASFPGRRTS